MNASVAAGHPSTGSAAAAAWEALRRDDGVRWFLVFVAALNLPFVAAPEELARTYARYSDLLLFPVVIFVVLHGLRHRERPVEARFWSLVALGFGFWWMVRLLYVTLPESARNAVAGIAVDGGYVLFYLSIFLAIEIRPHLEGSRRSGARLRTLRSSGVLILVFGLLIYFVLVPSELNRAFYASNLPSLFLFVALDLSLVLRFLQLVTTVENLLWRNVYGLLGMAMALWMALDFAETLSYAGLLSWSDGTPVDLLWSLPVVAVAAAARLRQAPLRLPEPSDEAVFEPGLEEVESRSASPLLLAAFTFPLVHLAIQTLGLLDPASAPAREAVAFLGLLVLGTLALVEHAVLRRESARAARQRRRAEKEIEEQASRRRLAERTLSESEERFRKLSEAAFEGILISEGGKIIEANEQAARIFGFERQEILGQDIAAAVVREEKDLVHERIRQGYELPYEVACHRRDGVPLVIEVQGKSLPYRGRQVRVTALRDVTERRRLEEQLRQAQKLEAVGRLAGGIAHDFNNLLTVIVGHAEILVGRLAGDPREAHARRVSEAAERATSLTMQLLAFSRKQPLEPRVLDLNEVVAGLEEMLRRLIREDVELEIELAPRLRAVEADPTQIEQVVINLALNARDAMPLGGRLRIETAAVAIAAQSVVPGVDLAPGAYTRLTVSDTGTGIAPGDLEQIFEPFFSTKPRGEGTGLGLATVYGIVKQSGGEITVESELGRGTAFHILLPAADGAVEGRTPGGREERAPRGSEIVMVVEDVAEVREVVVRFLELGGYRVLEADGPARALELAREHPEKIDLLLSDVVMPEMNGCELAERLLAERPETAVLFMSGYARETMANQGLEVDPERLLTKPFTMETLYRRLRQVLTRG